MARKRHTRNEGLDRRAEIREGAFTPRVIDEFPDRVRWEAAVENLRMFQDVLARYGSWANYLRRCKKRRA